MKTRLLNLWESVRTSFWFIPAIMVLFAVVLSFLISAVDQRVNFNKHAGALSIFFKWEAEGARSILSVIGSSMMTIIGVVFSITIVALALASTQFGPRLLRNFMKDKGHQMVLGTFTSTFIYCLMVLRTIPTWASRGGVPGFSVSLAMILALISIGVLIYFIHHVCTSIQAEHVVSGVYRDLIEDMTRLFPDRIELKSTQRKEKKIHEHDDKQYSRKQDIVAKNWGYLQAIDTDTLLELAHSSNLLIQIHRRPGEFIVGEGHLLTVHFNEALQKSDIDQLIACFILGQERTPEQDAEFAVDQLVEVALRALSPGINDSFTAISCVDRLGAALCFLTDRIFPNPFHLDGDSKLRVISRVTTFEGIVRASFDQIRQYSSKNVAVSIRILEAMIKIAFHIRKDEQGHALLHQAEMIRQKSKDVITVESDGADIERRYQALLEELTKKSHKKINDKLPRGS